MPKCYRGTCPTCQQSFESTRRKKFCSVKCRANSPDFIAVAKRNAVKAREARSRKAREERRHWCEQCGHQFEAIASAGQRFCSRGCARRFRAAQFDDLVAVLEQVPRLTNFDEFLSRDILHCPIDGCHWHGEDLGQHVSQGHGIPAAKFKAKAGFNKHTGLIGRDLSRRLSARNRRLVPLRDETRGHGTSGYVMQAEAREHHEKAMLLREKSSVDTAPTDTKTV